MPPTCQTGQLDLVQGRGGVALGTAALSLSFRNHTAQGCSLTGYPSIAIFDAQGHMVPIQLQQVTVAYTFNSAPVQMVALAAGAQAYFKLQWADGTGSQVNCATAATAEITPPGSASAITAPLQVRECGGTLTISPVEPTSF
ncbi:MAG TPA: DUF4232 domain-containing protein [Ktedonobacterales bacterium]|nr:DUF4232 domain-containing protein [Ktedonobacterales bacterium]